MSVFIGCFLVGHLSHLTSGQIHYSLLFLNYNLFFRGVYFMAPSFVDKQKWVATLEAIVNHSGKEERSQDVVSTLLD